MKELNEIVQNKLNEMASEGKRRQARQLDRKAR